MVRLDLLLTTKTIVVEVLKQLLWKKQTTQSENDTSSNFVGIFFFNLICLSDCPQINTSNHFFSTISIIHSSIHFFFFFWFRRYLCIDQWRFLLVYLFPSFRFHTINWCTTSCLLHQQWPPRCMLLSCVCNLW